MEETRESQQAALFRALSLAQAEYPPIAKSKTAQIPTKSGGKYSYNYADLADVIKAITPVNAKHGLSFTQMPFNDGEEVFLTTVIHHVSGHTIESTLKLNPPDETPQTLGSAITYARRYMLAAMFGLVTEDDDDGAIASQKREYKSKPVENKVETKATTKVESNGEPHLATDKQIAFVESLIKKQELDEQDVAAVMQTVLDEIKEIGQLSVADANKLIEYLRK